MADQDPPANPVGPQEPANRGVRRKITVPPEYKGTESAQRWLARFELCSRCNEWDEAAMYNQVLPLLGGDALDLILDKDPDDIPDYESVKELLIQEFDNSELREQYVQDFKNRKLKDGEDYSAFMRALKTLSKKAYPDFDDKPRNALVADRYREEMPEKVRAVLSLLSIEAEDLDQLVSETRRLSKATDAKKTSPLFVSAVSSQSDTAGATGGTTNDAILAKLQEMESHMAEMKLSQNDMELRVNNLYSRPRSSGRPGTPNRAEFSSRSFGGSCWNCGDKGHTKRDCPGSKGRSSDTTRFLPHITCTRCGNPGHYASKCKLGNA